MIAESRERAHEGCPGLRWAIIAFVAVHESDLVPFAPAELLAERLLVLAPHPDDEVIACGGIIAQHRNQKRQVRVIVATDGHAAAAEQERSAYTERRERESVEALRRLGADDPPLFLRFPDRQLSQHREELEKILTEELRQFLPDVIACPAPSELHPDHAALSRALVELLQRVASLASSLALTRIVFYEVSQPIRPNLLVDISRELELKRSAIEAHESQTAIRDYARFALGLNLYRSMTLPPEVTAAEAFWSIPVSEIAVTSWSELARKMAPSPVALETRELPSIATIIRTRDRLALLREAVESARRCPASGPIIVVNDGGESPSPLFENDPRVKVVNLERNEGRSAAMNRGVAATEAEFLTFLDDDDLFYENHIMLLGEAAAREPAQKAFYTDAVNAFHERDAAGRFQRSKALRLYSEDFDPALLVLDNYVPLITLCLRHSDYLAIGGFDETFDLFEDWDFLLRLSERGNFVHIPVVTCEVRHFAGSGSLAVEASRDLERLRAGKERIWKKHAHRLTPVNLTDAVERLKRRIETAVSTAAHSQGRASHLELDVTRLTREKELLIEQLQRTFLELTGTRDELHAVREDARLTRELLHEHEQALARAIAHQEEASRALDDYRHDQMQKDEHIGKLYSEIARLNGLLDTIYASRSWKLHQLVERISGRG